MDLGLILSCRIKNCGKMTLHKYRRLCDFVALWQIPLRLLVLEVSDALAQGAHQDPQVD